MVEFALVALPLLLLVGGIIDFGLLLHAKVAMQAGAREGARAAAVGKAPQGAAETSIGHLSYIDNVIVVGGACTGSDDPPADAAVTVTGTYTFIFAKLIGFDTWPLSATATMRCET